MHLAAVLAQAVDSSIDSWVNFGAAGLVVLSLIFGWLVPGRSFDREATRADRMEDELKTVIPLLVRAVAVLDKAEQRRNGE